MSTESVTTAGAYVAQLMLGASISDERRALAFHEAAHAVCAVVLRWHVKHVTICGDRRFNGHVAYERNHGLGGGSRRLHRLAQRQIHLEHAIIAEAGVAAERKLNTRALQGGALDAEITDTSALMLGSDEASKQALKHFAEKEAAALVSHEWPAISAVAETLLLDCDTLSGRRVEAIVRRVRDEQARMLRDIYSYASTHAPRI